MKKIIYTVLLAMALSPVAIFAQKSVKKGDKQFSYYNYYEALSKYEHTVLPSIDVERHMAVAYTMTGNLKSAELHEAKINAMPAKNSEDVWNYAQLLMQNEKYTEAKIQLDLFSELAPTDSRAVEYAKAGDFVSKIKSGHSNVTLMNLDINSEEEDLSPVIYNDRIVFISSRYKIGPVYREWDGNQMHFLNLYVSQKKENGQLASPEKFPGKINRKYHDGSVAFSPDGMTMVMTIDNYNKRSAKGERDLQLQTWKNINGKWSMPEDVPFNSSEYSVGHPSFSADGKTLYFVSDMPGGKGGTDIYKVSYNNGGWGTPENLESINTEANEMFPYAHASGVLFFSSNGHVGLGGLDLFVGELKKDGTVGKFMNAGAPLNSCADDFGVALENNLKTGYITSNRKGGKGDDDIYYFTMDKPFLFGKTVQGLAKDKKGSVLSGATVVLTDSKGKKLNEVLTDEKGKFSFLVEKEEVYNLTGKKASYFDGINQADARTDNEVLTADVVLEKDPGLSMYVKVTDKKTSEPMQNVALTVVNNMSGEEEKILTPATGDYLQALNGKKLNDRISYNIRLEKEGYVGKTITYNQLLDKEGRYNVSETMDVTLEKIEVGADLAKMANLKPIYFDLARFTIRTDAATELDKIVKLMNENPKMEIELGSHTDCRGTEAANLTLSDKRAKASAEYIKSRITNPERIYGKGYGESQLLNNCGCEGKVKSVCSEQEHQENRRTEFRVIKM